MAPDSDHPALVRLRAWCAARGIDYKGSLVKDGKFWRARLRFSDSNLRFNAPADTKEEAIERVVGQAMVWREKDELNPPFPINSIGALSGNDTPESRALKIPGSSQHKADY